MAKFKLKIKLQGLEIEVEGTKEDAPMIANNIGQQLTGLLQPASSIAGVDEGKDQKSPVHDDEPDGKKQRTRKRRAVGNGKVTDARFTEMPSWTHDSMKWGMPTQKWSTSDKAIWLLYVVSQATDYKELTATQIAETFNGQFRQAGSIRATNVSRDFGLLKINQKEVGETVGQGAGRWFLTQAGLTRAQAKIKECLTVESN